jgi:hypothetical protein
MKLKHSHDDVDEKKLMYSNRSHVALTKVFFTTNSFIISSNELQEVLHHSSLQNEELEVKGTEKHDAHWRRRILSWCSEDCGLLQLATPRHRLWSLIAGAP